ncbi:MAG TPA: sulfatase-like hydrolase/transferase, partial [Gemmatimonadaceae bacterium]|nr:sulfatase-like hydrolase/transferase [Gemmatimonadaceae bacterium]
MQKRGDGSVAPERGASGDGRGGSVAPAELFTVYLSVALLAAFSQVALIAYWTFGPGYVTRLGPRVIWMAPLAVAVVYAFPAIALLLLSRVWPRAGSLPVVFGTFSVLATIDLALMERRLALWAIGLLALGIGVQMGRIAEAHRAAFMRFARTTMAVLILLVLLGAAAVEIGVPWRERSAESRLPAAEAGAPNVLLIILDTVRALNLGLHGYARNTTPVLDSLAATSTVFDRAIVTGTWSVPSHASIFTGHWPHALTTWWRPPRRAPVPTLAETFSERGYRTGAVVANWWSLGRESGLAQGFLHYDDLGVSPSQIMRGSAIVRWFAGKRGLRRMLGLYDSVGRRGAPEISRNFLRWSDASADRPYFVFLNYLDAHSPYLPPPPFDRSFGYDVSAREPIVMEEL